MLENKDGTTREEVTKKETTSTYWKELTDAMNEVNNASILNVINQLMAIDEHETVENVEEVKLAIAKLNEEMKSFDEKVLLEIKESIERNKKDNDKENDSVSDVVAYVIGKLNRRLRVSENRLTRGVNENFGALIRHLRTKMGYSLQTMEKLTGISASYINRMEKGERKAPSFKIIEELSKALEIDKATLLESANLEDDTNVISVDELFYRNNFSISGQMVNKKQKELFVKIMTKIADAKWTSNTKHIDSVEIVELINQFKEIQND